MATVPQRDLRNRTAEVLRRVEQGERITVTVHGRPAADLVPPSAAPAQLAPIRGALAVLRALPADPLLRAELAADSGQLGTLDEL